MTYNLALHFCINGSISFLKKCIVIIKIFYLFRIIEQYADDSLTEICYASVSSTKGLKLKIGLRQGYTINKENTRIPEPQFL